MAKRLPPSTPPKAGDDSIDVPLSSQGDDATVIGSLLGSEPPKTPPYSDPTAPEGVPAARVAEILARFPHDVSRTPQEEDPEFSTLRDAPREVAPSRKKREGEPAAPATQRPADGSLPYDETIMQKRPVLASSDKRVGATLAGRYRLLRVLGEGGMGTVFEAVHLELGKRVAIKILTAFASRHDDASARFLREARAASAVESEHIVHVFDVGEDLSAGLYMVMELLKGEDLAALLDRIGLLSSQDAAGLVWQVTLALERAHAAGVVHRDLKPANVFLTRSDDGSIHVKVLDFGIAKLLREAQSSRRGITRPGMAIGTPQYMSPEQAQGLETVDARTDVYSVGALLYECITGRPPYQELGSYEQTIVKILMADPPRPSTIVPEIAPAMEALIAELMARDVSARPASLELVRRRMIELHPGIESRRLVLGGAGVPPPAGSGALPQTGGGIAVASRLGDGRVKRRSIVAVGVGAVALTGALAAGLAFTHGESGGRESEAKAAAAGLPIEGEMPLAITLDPTSSPSVVPAAHEPLPPSTAGADRASQPLSPVAHPLASSVANPPPTVASAPVPAGADAASLVRDAKYALEGGNVSRATALALAATQRGPTSAEAWLTLAAAYQMGGDQVAAKHAYTSCAQRATDARRGECVALMGP